MLAGALLVTLSVCAPASRPIVAEVFYDATGDDTGLEFVELYNPTLRAYPLGGVRLEAGDGAGPGRWTLRWTGAPVDTIPPAGRFVIGGARVQPTANTIVELALQNGPDAVRLVWPDGALEVVGYGPLAYPEYFCGTPAPDVASGGSLARIPDDADRGSNALDFRASAPSPGRANQPSRDLALVPGSLELSPEQPAIGGSAALAGAVLNRGVEPLHAGEAVLVGASSGSALFEVPVARDLGAGDSAAFRVESLRLAAGKQWLRVQVALAGDEAPDNDADSLLVRVGPGPLAVTEIQFHPAAGEGEWVEVQSRADGLDLGAFTLSDRGAGRGAPSGGEGLLGLDSLAVLAQDRAAFLARYPGLDSRRVWQVTPWASLNNSDDSTGVADAVVLRDNEGTRCDRVDYSAAGVPAGLPLERDGSGAWGPASDPGGTPLAPPRAPPAHHARFELSPRRLRPGGGLSLGWALPWASGRIAIEVYDLAGRRVAEPAPETEVARQGERRWSTAALPPGVYVVALRASDRDRRETLVETRALRIEGLSP